MGKGGPEGGVRIAARAGVRVRAPRRRRVRIRRRERRIVAAEEVRVHREPLLDGFDREEVFGAVDGEQVERRGGAAVVEVFLVLAAAVDDRAGEDVGVAASQIVRH